jgi:hypothetical protein
MNLKTATHLATILCAIRLVTGSIWAPIPERAPLKVPDNIHDEDQLLAYFEAWRAAYRPGTYRPIRTPIS